MFLVPFSLVFVCGKTVLVCHHIYYFYVLSRQDHLAEASRFPHLFSLSLACITCIRNSCNSTVFFSFISALVFQLFDYFIRLIRFSM